MTRARLAAGLCALLLAAPAAAKIRAVFVGIDQYAHSRAANPAARFDDLSGAVRDTRTIKAALARTHGLVLDEPADGCRGSNAVSTTLLNRCATKAAILAAWDEAIATTPPGDTLILYFAGHGSSFVDAMAGDQASGFNSTLMAHDARRPGDPAGADIIDAEVRDRIDLATSRGIRVLTIFDSCNSGTASRDGIVRRTAPPLAVSGLAPRARPQQYGRLGAWRAHLAAAADLQDAREVGAVGQRAGVFTTALAAALAANTSLADIAARVVAEVTAKTGGGQVPHAEGALRATIDGPEIRVPTLDVARDSASGDLVLAGGGLVGVTPGSRYAVFATTGAATSSAEPLFTARVARMFAGTARLEAQGPLPATLPGRLIAREIAHEFGGRVLPLRVADPAALPVVRRLAFVAENPAGPFALVPAAAGLALLGRDGGELAMLPPASAPEFPVRLARALEKVARAERWLALLATGTAQPVTLCVQNLARPADFDPRACPAEPPRLRLLQPATVGVVNTADAPRHIYVLAIGRRYEITVVLPAFGGIDPPLGPGQTLQMPANQRIRPNVAGPLRFVALAADQPLNAAAVEQSGTDVVDPEACLSPVAQAFCIAADRARAGNWPQVRAWSATILNSEVVP